MSDLDGDAAIERFFETGGSELPPDIGAPPPEEAPEAPETPAPAAVEPPPAPPAQQQLPPADDRVPKAALMEERRKRQELEARLSAIEGRLPQPEAPKVPSKDEDPIGYFEAKIANLERQSGETAQQFQQRQQFEALASHVGAAEQRFAATAPDYYDATEHLGGALTAFFKASGLDGETAAREAANARFSLVQNAIRNGKDPAAAAYDLAKHYGYTPKGAAPVTTASATPPRAPDGKFQSAEKLAAVAKGQAAAKSLSAANGGAPDGDPISALLAAADDPTSPDFDANWTKVFGRAKDRPLFR